MMTYDNLPRRPVAAVLLYCRACGGEYSATRGDYFLCDPGEEAECGECGHPLALRRKVTTFEAITPREVVS